MKRRLTYVAIAGNALFVLWVLRNGINESFRGTPAEIASFIGLTLLLALNSGLLWRTLRRSDSSASQRESSAER